MDLNPLSDIQRLLLNSLKVTLPIYPPYLFFTISTTNVLKIFKVNLSWVRYFSSIKQVKTTFLNNLSTSFFSPRMLRVSSSTYLAGTTFLLKSLLYLSCCSEVVKMILYGFGYVPQPRRCYSAISHSFLKYSQHIDTSHTLQ